MSDTEELPPVPDYLSRTSWWKPETNYAPVTRNGHEIGFYGYIEETSLALHKLIRRALGESPIRQEDEVDEFVSVSGMYPTNQCHVCGETISIEVNFATRQYRAVGEPCKYLDGVPCVVRLEVPSGVIVAENDFRPLLWKTREEDPAHDFNVNFAIWTVRTTEEYAKHKMIQAFVGNTCPGIYRIDSKTLHVSNSGWTEDDQEIPPPGERVGSICTDLWWYSMMDKDEFERVGGNEYYKVWEESGHWTKPDFIEVEPGTYEFTHYASLKSFDRDAPGVVRWTDIKLVE